MPKSIIDKIAILCILTFSLLTFTVVGYQISFACSSQKFKRKDALNVHVMCFFFVQFIENDQL